jgi:sugar/nucleoside kinase (ribokinase family)
MNVILVGGIGDDYYGKLMREVFGKIRDRTSYIKDIPGKNTGLSIEIRSENQQKNRYYFSPGANMNDVSLQCPSIITCIFVTR